MLELVSLLCASVCLYVPPCLYYLPLPTSNSCRQERPRAAPALRAQEKGRERRLPKRPNQRVLAQLAWFTPLAETGVSESRFLSLSSVYS